MLCSKIRVQTISLLLLITYLVNFYPIYSISPKKSNEAFSSSDSSESSNCYYSDSEGYYADSEGNSDTEVLLRPGEYPEKTSFSNPIPRRKNEKWSLCSSGTKELCVYFGESLESSSTSCSGAYSDLTTFPYAQKSSNSSHSSLSKEHSDSGTSSYSQESQESSDSSHSSLSKEHSDSGTSPYSQESQESSDSSHSSLSKEHSDSSTSSYSQESQESSDSSHSSLSKKHSDSGTSPYFQESQEPSDSFHSSPPGETNSSTTIQKNKNLIPNSEEHNLILEHMIENVSSHMADRAMIARQKIKCYIKDVLLDKNIYRQLKPELLISVMCYWDRINYVKLINDTKDEKNELDRFFYTLITLLCIADKFTGDDFSNITVLKWAWAGLVPLIKLIHYEKVLLENIDYRLYVSREDYLYYKEILKSCTNFKTS